MLIRHTLIYSTGRVATGLLNLAIVALYTRLLTPAQYGRYALVVAGVGLVSSVAFQWLQAAARRFFAAYDQRRDAFFSTLRTAYLRIAGAVLLVAVVAAVVWPDPRARTLIGLGTILLLAQAWFELNLEVVMAALAAVRYSALSLARTALALVGGGALAYLGLGAPGVLVGAIVGYLVAGGVATRRQWRGRSLGRGDVAIMGEFMRYGLPLTATLALAFVVSSSDRVLLGWLRGTADVGTYGAAYDLTFQGLTALMMLVNLSGFPLAVRALESRGLEAAREQLTKHAILLVALAMPATVGLVLLAPNVAVVLFGAAYREPAARLIPWLAAAAFLSGVKALYFDLSFQLGRATMKQVWATGGAVVVNLALNFLWIPRFGPLGAAWASVAAFLVGGALSVLLGRAVLPMPVPAGQWARIAAASTLMVLVLVPLASSRGEAALTLQVLTGATAYLAAALLLNVGHSRARLGRVLWARGTR